MYQLTFCKLSLVKVNSQFFCRTGFALQVGGVKIDLGNAVYKLGALKAFCWPMRKLFFSCTSDKNWRGEVSSDFLFSNTHVSTYFL